MRRRRGFGRGGRGARRVDEEGLISVLGKERGRGDEEDGEREREEETGEEEEEWISRGKGEGRENRLMEEQSVC